jgi:glycosyl-4,4'-diaponeurosporenoate acyltransferase
MFFGIGFSVELCVLDIVLYVFLQSIRVLTDRALPARWLDPELPCFRTRAWEHGGRFYQDHFQIARWKDRLPAVDGLNTVSKKKLKGVAPDYLRQFIVETCRGESHHMRTILETILFILWNPVGLFCCVFILSLLLNVPCIFIQRYNRPRLQRLLLQVESRKWNSAAIDPQVPRSPYTA